VAWIGDMAAMPSACCCADEIDYGPHMTPVQEDHITTIRLFR